MRKIIPIIFGIAIILLTSCKYQNGKSMEDQVIYGDSASIGKYDVRLLFEVDDVKIYRFVDRGYYIYFTNCQGKTQYTYQQGAKPPQSRKIECLCNQNYGTNN